MTSARIAMACIGIGLLAALPALADTKITMHEGSGIAGDPADAPEGMRQAFENQEPTTAIYWFGEERSARVGDSGSMISRLDRGETYIVNDQNQSYSVIEMDGDDDSDALSGTAELVETGERRKIGSWNATRYDMTVMMAGDEPAEVTLWVSDEVDVDLSAYHAIVRATASRMGSDWMLKYLEVQGFPVRQEFRMGPIQSWQEVVSIEEASPPAGIYEPPAGYTRSD